MRLLLKTILMSTIFIAPFTGFAENLTLCERFKALNTHDKIELEKDWFKTKIKKLFSNNYTITSLEKPQSALEQDFTAQNDQAVNIQTQSKVTCNANHTVTVVITSYWKKPTDTLISVKIHHTKVIRVDLSPDNKIKTMHVEYSRVYDGQVDLKE